MKRRKIAALLITALLFSACGKAKVQDSQSVLPTEDLGIEIDTETEALEDTEEVFVDTDIEIIMIGDMLMHDRVIDSGLKEDGTYDYSHLFVHVIDKVAGVDLAIVNQESIIGGSGLGLSGYPTFNSPYELGDAEAAAGFDVVLGATNHALDKSSKGILNEIEFWKKYSDIAFLGLNESSEDKENYIYTYTQNDITIAILNYTYGTNGIEAPSGMEYLVNLLEEKKVVADIEKAHELADFVIVCPHWGTEYVLGTDSMQKKWTQIFLENGVDLVIGTHPHVIEPVEWVTDEEGHKMLVYYSLGNFVNATAGTGEGAADRMVGGMADVTIKKLETGEVEISEYSAIPLVCHIGEGESMTTYFMSDYTEELAGQNKMIYQDSNFSLEYCKNLVKKVWGEQ